MRCSTAHCLFTSKIGSLHYPTGKLLPVPSKKCQLPVGPILYISIHILLIVIIIGTIIIIIVAYNLDFQTVLLINLEMHCGNR